MSTSDLVVSALCLWMSATTLHADATFDEATLIALRASPAELPDPHLEEEIRADLVAIRAAHPELATVYEYWDHDPGKVQLLFEPGGRERYLAGDNGALNAIDAALGVCARFDSPDDPVFLVLSFSLPYQPAYLVASYVGQAEVEAVDVYPGLTGWTTCGTATTSFVHLVEPRTYHFWRVVGTGCFETNWQIRVSGSDDVEVLEVWGDDVPVTSLSWGTLKARY